MILTGLEIAKQVESKKITISPFSSMQINPNSYDFRLGNKLLEYVDDELDVRRENRTRTHSIAPSGFVLERGRFYLGHTEEVMGSSHYVPIIRAKSSIARLGLFIHITADLIDIGSVNQWTLQLLPTHSIIVYPGMRIGQVTFWQTFGEVALYDGKYQGTRGPAASKSYLDSL